MYYNYGGHGGGVGARGGARGWGLGTEGSFFMFMFKVDTDG